MPTYNCNDYNCDEDIGTHTPIDCNDFSRGGYPNCIILACGHAITDPGNATQVQTALDSDLAWLVQNVTLELPAPSAVKVDSPIANEPQLVTGYEYSGTLTDGNVSSANCTFYNNVGSGKAFGGIIFHNKQEGKVYWHNDSVRFEGGLVLPRTDAEIEMYTYTFNFKKDADASNPTIATEPAGIFD